MSKKKKATKQQNFVAKHAKEFNHAQVHRDRTKYYRKDKHPGKDAFFWLKNLYLDKCYNLFYAK